MSKKKYFSQDDRDNLRNQLSSTTATLEGSASDRDGGFLRRVAYLTLVASVCKQLITDEVNAYVASRL